MSSEPRSQPNQPLRGRSEPHPLGEVRLPWDETSERAVIGSILLDPVSIDAVFEILTPADFYRPSHRAIMEALAGLSARSEAIDAVTLQAELQRIGTLERVGGARYIASLLDGLPRASNVGSYARIVHDRAIARRILEVAETLREQASSAARPAIEVLDEAQGELFRLGEAGRRTGFRPIAEVAAHGLQLLEELAERREMVTGLATGIRKLDAMTSGLQRGELVILAARPSMGKTALAVNIAGHAAVRGGEAVGIFSLEMSSQQLFFRLLSGEGSIDSHKLRTGRLSKEDWARLTDTYETLAKTKVFIDDTPNASPMEIRSKARRLKAEHDVGLIVIDYLQLMRSEGRHDSRQQEISEISRSLKAIAKELSTPVLALSQLSRAPDQRTGDHRPQLSDLRESGAIEQDADIVMFIYRPEVYEKDEQKIIANNLEGKAEVIVAKQRNGPTGRIPLFFVKEYTRFYEQDDTRDAGSF